VRHVGVFGTAAHLGVGTWFFCQSDADAEFELGLDLMLRGPHKKRVHECQSHSGIQPVSWSSSKQPPPGLDRSGNGRSEHDVGRERSDVGGDGIVLVRC
jgi:hypothetical protein